MEKTVQSLVMAGKSFTKDNPLVIAEIGTAHGGSIGKARELIAAAAESGADCAKFQIVFADEILHPKAGLVELHGGKIPLYERFKALELPFDFFAEAKAECERRGLIFLCSVFGKKSAQMLKEMEPVAVKIASPELNHFPLIKECAQFGAPLILSTGVSTLDDIERALLACKEAAPACGIALLHCITAYPAPEEEYSARTVSFLEKRFSLPCGVSDHSLDPVLVPALGVACGACAIEKHICLSKKDGGLDDPVALDPAQFRAMVKALREAAGKQSEEIVSMMKREYGDERVERILGREEKRLAPSEAANYGKTNRSLHYMRSMKAGEAVSESDVAILRTEKALTAGISPLYLAKVIGARLARDVENGAGVQAEDFESLQCDSCGMAKSCAVM